MENESIDRKVIVKGRHGKIVDVSGGRYRVNWEGSDEWSWIVREDLEIGVGQEEKDAEEGLIGKEVTVGGRKGQVTDVSARRYRVDFEGGEWEWVEEGLVGGTE